MLNNAINFSTKSGFTLIELILVILLIGILTVIVYPRWTAQPMGLNYEARRVLGDIRYAQAMSLTTGQRYRWVRTSNNAYQILNEAGFPLVLPNGVTTFVLSGGATFSAFSNLPNNLIAFDAQGAPYTDAGLPGTTLAAIAVVPLTLAGQTRFILIVPQTGLAGIL